MGVAAENVSRLIRGVCWACAKPMDQHGATLVCGECGRQFHLFASVTELIPLPADVLASGRAPHEMTVMGAEQEYTQLAEGDEIPAGATHVVTGFMVQVPEVEGE